MPRRFLTAEWKHLVMLNYVIDPHVLQPLVPAGTELDTWRGQHFVSMVGFYFQNTKVMGLPIPFHRHFEEINLRFYVRRETSNEVRRGVVFVKEIVPRFAIAAVARWLYNEKYIAHRMDHLVELPTPGTQKSGIVEYGWKQNGKRNFLRADIAGEPSPMVAGSEEEFITEHYWGYTSQRDGSTMEYRVEHPPWQVWRANSSTFDCDVKANYGEEFVSAFSQPPASAFVAVGSPIAVYRGEKMPGKKAS